MRYVRPFSLDELKNGASPNWLLSPEEGLGFSIRLHRGGVVPAPPEMKLAQTNSERFALALTGAPTLQTADGSKQIASGDLAFIPANTRGHVHGGDADVWAEIDAVVDASSTFVYSDASARVIAVDPTRFEGGGFAYQSMIERKSGAQSMRINVLQVQPGSGSPDFHIHAFAQIYLIQEGEMTIEAGRQQMVAKKHSLVVLPAGLVHRNYNAGSAIERHISLLVPEPREGEIFDYAITIHDREAEMMQQIPARS